MSNGGDIVHRFMELLSQHQPSFSEEIAFQIERQIRHEYGGEETYIAKTPSEIKKRKEKALQAVKNGDKPVDAADRNGISRRTMYRLLEKSNL